MPVCNCCNDIASPFVRVVATTILSNKRALRAHLLLEFPLDGARLCRRFRNDGGGSMVIGGIVMDIGGKNVVM